MAADGTGSGAGDEVGRNHMIADSLKIVSSSLLGLTVGCAQCHDHRYDPISQKDYYQLRAVFEPALSGDRWRTPIERRVSLYTDEEKKKAQDIEKEAGVVSSEKKKKLATYMAEALDKELSKYKEPLISELRAAYQASGKERTGNQKNLLKKHPNILITSGNLYQYNQKAADELKKYDEQIGRIRSRKPVEEFLRVVTEQPDVLPVTRVFYRGDPKQPKEIVSPAGLAITSPSLKSVVFPENSSDLKTSGRRLAFARWLVSGKHPLTARVIVNRIWLHHFGRGLVGTPGDFGALGEKPTHPEVLDWLADKMVNSNWSLKHLHRVIMLSTVYRQSSRNAAPGNQVDPANLLYWKMPVRRLDGEALRDRILSAAGGLKNTLYGKPVAVKSDDAGQIVEAGNPSRRSLYVQVQRSRPLAILTAFDAPVMEVNCNRRINSTVAPQSLLMMNSDFVLGQAKSMATRAMKEITVFPFPEVLWQPEFKHDALGASALRDLPETVARAWELAYCRPVTSGELSSALEFISDQLKHIIREPIENKQSELLESVMSNLCQALINSNEFLYVD